MLASAECPVTGTVLSAAGGRWAIQNWASTEERDLGPDATPDDLLDWAREATTGEQHR
jgi:hypothetical protein